MIAQKTNGGACGKPFKIRKLDSASDEVPRSHKPLLESNLDLLSHGRFSDVTFIVGEMGTRIPCHQLFLKARSPVFEVMFSERWNQDQKEVPLEDADPETFRKFLQFIYTDTLEASVSEALELLQLAHKYDVQLLVSKCEKLLESQVELDDSIAVFQTARKYDKFELMNKVGGMWAESLSKLQTLPSFTQLDKDTLMYILARDDLEMNEVDLFRLALQWAGNQTDATVEESLKDILPLIRFPTMTLNEFTTAVVPTEILPLLTAFKLFTYFGNYDEAKKSMENILGFSTKKRQPKNSIVYVALYPEYPEHIVDTRASLRRFQKLKECLQFFRQLPWNSHADPPQPNKDFGLSGIRFNCPTKAATYVQFPRAAAASFKAFEICLKSKYFRDTGLDLYSSHSYTMLLRLPNVKVEEGKITDIKFGTVIPLKKDTVYCITVEEEPGDVSVEGYLAKYFDGGPIASVDVNVRNTGRHTLNCRRNQLQGFVEDSNFPLYPKLIHKLGFQEI